MSSGGAQDQLPPPPPVFTTLFGVTMSEPDFSRSVPPFPPSLRPPRGTEGRRDGGKGRTEGPRGHRAALGGAALPFLATSSEASSRSRAFPPQGPSPVRGSRRRETGS